MSSPLASNDLDTPLDLTGSIDGLGNGADTDIDKEDRRAIAAAIEAAKPTADGPAAIAWANPLSGNTGTVTTINADGGVSGCLAFRTTANTIHGVRAYDGTACRDAFSALSVITLARTRS
ncbi:RT0821/Lpp0805 family surface protein [Polymorphum gilvum]|uniref:Pyridoxamine 5'-phosphate oxidase n=1 Tax=Polymorphum gilvum (strain LMG 25793 / CGMCC 1.9160 / SL003B-26A1) TaxID=991905 RepID=F2IYA0_POLGS|nr:RT0821/Lpp0805 family surface protein [Polymorphum gilvum]ADZ71712.1 Pyridoxamine 5'-phosphate oxidase [Polymorphum gilvum SL003B-26A1]